MGRGDAVSESPMLELLVVAKNGPVAKHMSKGPALDEFRAVNFAVNVAMSDSTLPTMSTFFFAGAVMRVTKGGRYLVKAAA